MHKHLPAVLILREQSLPFPFSLLHVSICSRFWKGEHPEWSMFRSWNLLVIASWEIKSVSKAFKWRIYSRVPSFASYLSNLSKLVNHGSNSSILGHSGQEKTRKVLFDSWKRANLLICLKYIWPAAKMVHRGVNQQWRRGGDCELTPRSQFFLFSRYFQVVDFLHSLSLYIFVRKKHSFLACWLCRKKNRFSFFSKHRF